MRVLFEIRVGVVIKENVILILEVCVGVVVIKKCYPYALGSVSSLNSAWGLSTWRRKCLELQSFLPGLG